jgi:Succinylglutamate desuccinylase / Aspartoacylase family
LYFQGVQTATGQYSYVSVTVAKGAKPGKRLVLISGVHGDEMSSVHTVQTVMNHLDPAEMSGTVMAVTDVSRPAMEGMQRRWPNSGRGVDLIDMNREWPGNENGATAPCRHAGLDRQENFLDLLDQPANPVTNPGLDGIKPIVEKMGVTLGRRMRKLRRRGNVLHGVQHWVIRG